VLNISRPSHPPPRPPPSLLLPDRPQCHCLRCQRSIQGTRLPLSSMVHPLPVATRHPSSSAPPSEELIGVLERDECSVPNNSPCPLSSLRVPPPVAVVLSSCCLLRCHWRQRLHAMTNVSPHPSLDTADCNVFFTSASARIPHKCRPPLTVEDQYPDTAPSSPLRGHGCHCRSHQRIPH